MCGVYNELPNSALCSCLEMQILNYTWSCTHMNVATTVAGMVDIQWMCSLK